MTREYDHKTNLRPLKYLREGGKYLLDVASGAVPQPEYLKFSDAFEKRICIDLSFLALQQARKKLGDKGIYILGDITNLPLQDDICDAVISLHTIYHVPADEQGSAFRELYRVLKPGRTALVIYNWGEHSFLMRLADIPLNPPILGTLRAFKRVFGGKAKATNSSAPSLPPRPARGLYFHAHTYRWFKREMSKYFDFDMVCWRIVDQQFLVYYIRPRFLWQIVSEAYLLVRGSVSSADGAMGAIPHVHHQETGEAEFGGCGRTGAVPRVGTGVRSNRSAENLLQFLRMHCPLFPVGCLDWLLRLNAV